jgi:hypothetical protein
MRSGEKTGERYYNATIPPLQTMTAAEQSHHPMRLIQEARQQDGREYPANTLHHIVTGIMRHL